MPTRRLGYLSANGELIGFVEIAAPIDNTLGGAGFASSATPVRGPQRKRSDHRYRAWPATSVPELALNLRYFF